MGTTKHHAFLAIGAVAARYVGRYGSLTGCVERQIDRACTCGRYLAEALACARDQTFQTGPAGLTLVRETTA